MKPISIKLEVPEYVDEEKFSARLKKLAEKIVYLEKLSAEEVREIFGTFEEEIEPVNVREKENKMAVLDTSIVIERFKSNEKIKEKNGKPKAFSDLVIASISINRAEELVTKDRDFEDISEISDLKLTVLEGSDTDEIPR